MEIFSVNGHIGGSISPLNRGLAYGDGVFETLRVTRGEVPLLPYHWQRLQEGCQRLKIPLCYSSLDQWLAELIEVGKEELPDAAILKVIVTRGAGSRGYKPDISLPPDIILSIHPLSTPASEPVELCICNYRLPSNPVLAGIKHLNRLDSVILQAECIESGYEDGLVLDAEDIIVEATSSNLFFEAGGLLYTPSIVSCGVDGVMRRFIVQELSEQLGITVSVGEINLNRLPDFESAFCCNSVRGVVPVARIGDYPLTPGKLTSRLQQKLAQLGY